MLDADTKRRIDTARDILVGKVPDPKSQVEQITIALIYKFMDDMDAGAEELGGKRKFFAKDFARYGWTKLMNPGLGGQEMLSLYADGITKMPENPGAPPLFREIFKNAYLPYRDPETLKSFLKIIDEFTYDHSERLGDAFEYLLSVLGSQGDAGQFRTPRHIIDFMVEVLAPQKGEVILDPACGTAGFLISAYKHILRANADAKGRTKLTPDEKGRLAKNFIGYDISPDMVRLSRVNLYLHGFTDPHIYEYDTLTSEERWNEFADVILANPPFMSPKGGIKPHRRFSIQAKRSEVLFVDYMAEHLSPAGRAAIIVPEGIIFQNQDAYKDLRKLLVDNSLVAVVSLPAGLFNPYSGVKTSILILDKSVARQSDTVAFFKVENDGFGLGAQRRAIGKNDLPQVKEELTSYLRALRSRQAITSLNLGLGQIVQKDKIAATDDYNLNGERYRVGSVNMSAFPSVELGEIVELVRGVVYAKEDEVAEGGVKVLRANNINKDRSKLNLEDIKLVAPKRDFSDEKKLKRGDIFICLASGSKDHIGKVAFIEDDTDFYFGGFMGAIRANLDRVDPRYLLRQLITGHFNDFLKEQIAGASINNISAGLLARFRIPLPPLDVQREIVSEIDGYQTIVDGARAILDNYRPHIPIQSDWPLVELEKICEINPDTINPVSAFGSQTVFYIDISSIENETGRFLGYNEVAASDAPSRARRGIRSGDVLISTVRPNLKAFTLLKEVRDRAVASTGFAVLRARSGVAEPAFVLASLSADHAVNQMIGMMGRGAYPSINQADVAAIKIPLPPLATQQAFVSEIEAEQALVAASRELATRFERKIQAALSRIWGEDKSAAPEA